MPPSDLDVITNAVHNSVAFLSTEDVELGLKQGCRWLLKLQELALNACTTLAMENILGNTLGT